MTQPLFSLLIAQYNNGKYFEDCYKSIMAQTYANWEVIIVDDGSTDDSVAVMKEMIGADSRFKLYSNTENKGCGYTKRELADRATGEFCAYVDPDDTIMEDAVEIMVKAHAEFTRATLIYSNSNICDENLLLQHTRTVRQVRNGDEGFLNQGVNVFALASFRRCDYLKTEGIDPFLKRAVDQDLYLKLYEVGNFVHITDYLYNYRIHHNGISTLANREKARFWYWVVLIAAARRRDVNIEDYFIEDVIIGARQVALEKEVASYNRSIIFKILRKLNLFKV